MDEHEAIRRFAESSVARLATVNRDGSPHIVPIVFAITDDRIVSAIDHKPKRSQNLRRLDNIQHEPRVSVIVDHYDVDWASLWWVRIDGRARIVTGDDRSEYLGPLVSKYPHYRNRVPEGPTIVIDVERTVGWSAIE